MRFIVFSMVFSIFLFPHTTIAESRNDHDIIKLGHATVYKDEDCVLSVNVKENGVILHAHKPGGPKDAHYIHVIDISKNPKTGEAVVKHHHEMHKMVKGEIVATASDKRIFDLHCNDLVAKLPKEIREKFYGYVPK